MTKKDKATVKNCSIKRECLDKTKKRRKTKKIPDENASYGKYAIFMENRPKKKEGLYVYIKQKRKMIFINMLV